MIENYRDGEQLFAAIMRRKGYSVEDTTNNPYYWSKDIDFIATSPTTNKIKSFEVKTDWYINRTGNLFLEIVNVNS